MALPFSCTDREKLSSPITIHNLSGRNEGAAQTEVDPKFLGENRAGAAECYAGGWSGPRWSAKRARGRQGASKIGVARAGLAGAIPKGRSVSSSLPRPATPDIKFSAKNRGRCQEFRMPTTYLFR
jgi:hypothetical protein